MNKLLAIILVSLSIMFTANSLAEGLNDNYLQFGFAKSGYNSKETTTDIKGSIDLGNNYSLIGDYVRETGQWSTGYLRAPDFMLKNWDSVSSKLSIGVGRSFDLYPKNLGDIILSYTQLTASLSAAKIKSNLNSLRVLNQAYTSTSSNKNHTIFNIGIRTISNYDIEMGAKYSVHAGNGANTSQFEVEASKSISKNLAVGGMFVVQKTGETHNKTGMFVRRSF